MLELSFEELVQDLRQRRVVGDPPPTLLLGAGASVESGVGAMTDLFRFVGCDDFDEFCTYIEQRTPPERYRLLAQFLQAREPAEVTPGYHALATLCAEAYFDLVLTTNLDPLLDDALAAARLWRKDYLVLVNGIMRTNWLGMLATAASPRVKVIKLHGDLFLRCMAWTVAEMDEMVASARKHIIGALRGRDLLIVGHSLHDERIRELVLGCKGSIWFTHPEAVPDFLAEKKEVRAVVSPDCTFEKLFTGLAKELVHVGVAAAPPAPTSGLDPAPAAGAQTLDDLMASVVGVGATADGANMTGFLLAEPRLIVTGYASNYLRLDPKRVTLFASGGRCLTTQVLRRDDSYAFGPLLLKAPDELRVPGLRLNPAPVAAGLDVRVVVAAGKRAGVSSGLIRDVSVSAQVEPAGLVENLVAIDCVTTGGSSGAPVVDGNLAVRGFVIAGAVERPPTLMYPAEYWAPFVEGV